MFAEFLSRLDPQAGDDPASLREFYRDVYRVIDEFMLADAEPVEISIDDPSPNGLPWSEVLVAPESDYPERVQLRHYVQELLRDLPREQCELLHRVYWQEQDLVAAADQMGLSTEEFDELHGRALARLRFLWARD